MYPPPAGNSLGCVVRLHRIRGRRIPTGLDGTESASASAGVAEKHDGGSGNAVSAAIPALANIGALGFLANGVEV